MQLKTFIIILFFIISNNTYAKDTIYYIGYGVSSISGFSENVDIDSLYSPIITLETKMTKDIILGGSKSFNSTTNKNLKSLGSSQVYLKLIKKVDKKFSAVIKLGLSRTTIVDDDDGKLNAGNGSVIGVGSSYQYNKDISIELMVERIFSKVVDDRKVNLNNISLVINNKF